MGDRIVDRRRGDIVELPNGELGIVESFQVEGIKRGKLNITGVNVRPMPEGKLAKTPIQIDPNTDVTPLVVNFEDLL